MSVTIADSVMTALRAAAEPGIFLMVRLQGRPGPERFRHVREAVMAANAAAEPGTVRGGYATETPRGVAVHLHAAPMTTPQQRAAVHGWLTAFADHLTAAALTGRVGTSGTWFPATAEVDSGARGSPAAFVGYTMDLDARWGAPFRGWQVSAEITERVAGGLESRALGIDGAESWATLAGPSVPIPTNEIGEYLTTTTALVRDHKGIHLLHQDNAAFSQYSLASHGQAVTQTVDPGSSWRTLLQQQLHLLLLAPEAADVGMIRSAWRGAADWSDADVREHQPTACDPHTYLVNRHHWNEYVVDASGINLLTGRHLSHARDLGDWTLEEVAPDRFLVSARDLEAWFGAVRAPSETVEKARADFGEMILTAETIRTEPRPAGR